MGSKRFCRVCKQQMTEENSYEITLSAAFSKTGDILFEERMDLCLQSGCIDRAIEAFCKLADRFKSIDSRWITPSEMLPPVGEAVLVCCHKCNPKAVGIYTMVQGTEDSFRRNISCWMPLPEPDQAKQTYLN